MANSMHRHNALSTQSPSPITDKTLVRPLNVVVARVLAPIPSKVSATARGYGKNFALSCTGN